MTVIAVDRRLEELVDLNARPEKIATGYRFTEGPVWDRRDNSLTYVDMDRDGGTIYRWTAAGGAQVFRKPSARSNGSTFDHGGRLITCVQGDGKVIRTNADGSIETIADSYGGRRFNAPNDVICTPDGDLIFTDPFFGKREDMHQPAQGVYRIAKDGTVTLLADDFAAPNGLAMTDDGRTLYVDDLGRQNLRVFDVAPDRSLGKGRVLAELKNEGLPPEVTAYLDRGMQPGATRAPDGLKLDSRGNIYVTANRHEGLWVFDPRGTLLGFIGVGDETSVVDGGPGGPANLAWGDDDWRSLYITATTSVYRIRMKVPGQPVRID
jgi:gluconolactonase